MLEFKVLGQLRVLVDGEDVPVDDPVERALLAGLLINANRAVSPVTIVRQHWPQTRPLPRRIVARTVESGRRLQQFVETLPGTINLRRSRDGYLLTVDEDLIDYFQVQASLVEASLQPPRRRAELLREVYRLWPTNTGIEAVWPHEVRSLRAKLVTALAAAEEANGMHSQELGLLAELRQVLHGLEKHSASQHRDYVWDDPQQVLELDRQPEPPTTPPTGGAVLTATDTLSVSMYLSDEHGHTAVEEAVEGVLRKAGLAVVERDDPILGSWFRKVRAADLGAVAAHAIDSRLVLAQDAHVTSTMLQNIGPVLTALQTTKEAVLRIGAVLIVKVDDKVVVHQLTAAQQLKLDHQPELAMTPREILTALRLRDKPGLTLQDGDRPEGLAQSGG